ncbi:uncharacterized protein LOC110859468 [Folsomia candida]|uniref:uncharacterized protein LOC110859468 n=1 Tax=Folsomia candida TaxID=158441 RepID=UPI000B8F7DD7|nr:uncharacterized protein LOC110859468 [Folsomia candida]
MMQKLQQIPNVKTDNYESWVKFGTGVDNLVSTIKSLGAKQQLPNPSLVDELVKKLPAQKAMEWEEFKLRKKLKFPSLSHLAKWLQPTVEAAYALCPLPGTSTEKLSTEKPNHDNRRQPANQRGVRKNDRVMVTTEKNEARQEADVNTRWAMVKEKGCCIGCLNRGHRMHECRSKRVCGIEGCQQTHCQLLHNRNARNSEESSHITQQQRNQSSEQEVALSAVSGRSNCNINYNVIPIYAKRRDGQLLPMYMVLDGYASLTSADDSIRQQLNVDGRRRPLTVQGFQSTTTTPNSYEVDIEIVSRLDGKSYTLRNVRTVPKLDLPSQSLTKETLKRFSHIEGTPILTYQNVVPTILVGMDNFELHLPEEMKIGRFGEPAAIRTAMGWALVGPTASPPKKLHHAFHINDQQDDPLHQLVKQFFTTEYVGVKPNLEKPRSRDDIKAQVIMDQTIRRVSHGWESGLLWRYEDVKLPFNKNYAFQRLKSMEKKMDQDPEFARQYVERIQEYQDKGFAKILPPEKAAIETSRTFYLPHFMAYNGKKPKKYRFVFDAAAKVYGKSLNDHLLQGPDKLVSLPGALFKFRQRRIAVTGDIKDMFHRIKIREEDASAQRFLWRGMDRDRDPDVMEMGVLIFGASCSPACAQEAKNKNAEQFKEEFPDAYKAIVHRHYMDDLLDSYDTEAQAIQMQKDIFEVHRRGSFHICNWLSNSPEVMKAIPAELQSKTSQSLDINKEDQIERVLGLFWMPEEDNFTFCLKYLKVSEDVMKGRRIPTKREVLSLVMSVFDPLGFLSTLTIKAKMILQRTWISEIGWDDEIPSSTHQAWKLWLTLLESITEFKVPRCYSPTFSRSTDNQLHIFGDGSEEAFGVVAYFRIAHGSQVTTALVMAKANVAPIKHLTIPRMELSSNLQPIGSFDRHDLFGRKQWRCVQVMADHFWKKWTKEYRPTLLRRHKWCQTTKPIKVGDVILEVNDNLPRNTWPMGRVIKLYPGKDDVIRVVDIKLANDVDEEKTATTQSSTNVNNYTDGRMLSP